MKIRHITDEDVDLVLDLGIHVHGREPGTVEACTELDGRQITVVYDSDRFERMERYHIVTAMLRRCDP